MSIGVMAPDLSEGYFTMVMNGVEEYLMRAQYFYFTASHYWNQELMQEYPRMLVERAVDGFLLLNTPSEIRSPLPTVAISAHNNSPGVTNIILDHMRAAELALRHLYDLGHRKIAFVKGPNIIPDTEYRWRSILEVARQLDIKIVPIIASNSMLTAGHREWVMSLCAICLRARATLLPSSASTISLRSESFARFTMQA